MPSYYPTRSQPLCASHFPERCVRRMLPAGIACSDADVDTYVVPVELPPRVTCVCGPFSTQ